MRRLLALPLLLALAACGDKAAVTPRADGTPSSSPPAHSYAADAVVLRVTYGGGLLPSNHVGDVPFFTLYGDGRVMTVGPQPAIYPGAAMPNVVVTRVSPDAVDWLADSARAAGVDGQRRDYGTPPIADGSTTRFHLSDEKGTADLDVYALNEGDGSPGYTAEQKANRERILAFYRLVTDPEKWPGTRSDEGLYEPAAVAVYATAYREDPQEPEPQEIAWRGPDPAKGTDVRGNACTVVTGAALATVLPDLRRANTRTRWTYGGKAWGFALRPLLPDEKECV